MAKKAVANVGQASRLSPKSEKNETGKMPVPRPSTLLDTRVVYCGDNLEQFTKLPGACVDLIYIDPPFNSNRNYEVFWGETKDKRAFEDRRHGFGRAGAKGTEGGDCRDGKNSLRGI
jgi:16S rRNA G966 N2-methylase RsmD